MNRRKQPIKHFRIYALITGVKLAYIGKTTAREMSAVYRHHIKGRCNHTRDTIGRAGNATQLHLLTDLTACTPVSYRHVVAWVHIFLAAGYPVVNQPGIIEDAENLYPETVRLVNSLLTTPLETILQRTHLPNQ